MTRAETRDHDQTLERLIRQVGKGVMGLGLKLSELQETVVALRSEAAARAAAGPPVPAEPPAPAGSGTPPAFEGLADVIDGLDRVIDRLGAHAEHAPVNGPHSAPRDALGWLGRWLRARAPGREQDERCRAELAWAVEGLGLLREQALDRLEREGIAPVPREGPFDPTHHRVVATERGGPPGRILRTVRRGFTIRRGGRTLTLRPGLVVVGAAPGDET